VKQNYLIPLFSIFFLIAASQGFSSDQKLPVIDGQEVVAMVNDDPITLGEFNYALSIIHSGGSEGKEGTHAGKLDYKGILDRLITIRLIRQEALNVGLNDLPEVKEIMASYSRQTLRGLLNGLYVKDVTADDEEVEKLYKEAITEFKLNSILSDTEDTAKKVEEEIKATGNFDEVIKKNIADKTVKGSGKGEYIQGSSLNPEIMSAVSKMKPGDVSPVIKLSHGFIIFRLEDVRMPENLEAKDKARQQALNYKREKELQEYKASLIKKYVKIDEEVLAGLDYESSVEEFEKLLKDTRTVAEIEGESPVTVAELTQALQNKYYHGAEQFLEKRKLNDKKRLVLYDDILQKRVLLKEALILGVDKSPRYKGMLKDYESSILFDLFLRKIIVPDIKVDAETVEKYYKEHIDEYSTPEIFKVRDIIFEKRQDAEDALDKLKKGTDFKWLKESAEGQVDKDAKDLLNLEGTMSKNDLAEDVQQAISGAKPGGVRLYISPEKYFYVLYIEDVAPPHTAPFENVRSAIYSKIFKDKVASSVDDWANKLRKVYEVKIYEKDF
jgi:parvulin-like peptidyl-prolyl isomerase